MPKIDKVFSLDITPERFLAACSDTEIIELDLLLEKEIKRRERLNEDYGFSIQNLPLAINTKQNV